MDAGLLLPILPFVILLFTELRLAAILSAAAGAAAGGWVATLLPRTGWDGWLWWLLIFYFGAISLAMVLAEAVVAAVVLRGRFFRGLLFGLLAHAAWMAWLLRGMSAGDDRGALLLLVETAMLGASAVTVGARRRG